MQKKRETQWPTLSLISLSMLTIKPFIPQSALLSILPCHRRKQYMWPWPGDLDLNKCISNTSLIKNANCLQQIHLWDSLPNFPSYLVTESCSLCYLDMVTLRSNPFSTIYFLNLLYKRMAWKIIYNSVCLLYIQKG